MWMHWVSVIGTEEVAIHSDYSETGTPCIFFFYRTPIHHERIILSYRHPLQFNPFFLYDGWIARTLHAATSEVILAGSRIPGRECQPIHKSHDDFRAYDDLDSALSPAWVIRSWLSNRRVLILLPSLLEAWSTRSRSINIIALEIRATMTAFSFSSTRSFTNLRICILCGLHTYIIYLA